MNNAKKLIALACAAALLSLPAMAQDKAKPADDKKAAAPAKAAPAKAGAGATKVLVDNDKFLVTEITYKPGEGTEMRERNARVARAMTDGKMERTTPDGKKVMVEWKAGEAKAFPKETFANKNVGTKDMVLYVVTPK
jgi:hypothetical protein